jgi:hypothetical protein
MENQSESLIRCTDTDDVLSIWSYSECENDSPEEIKKQRGMIKDKEEQTIVTSFGYTNEYTEADLDTLQEKLGNQMNDWVFHYAVEGTLLRMFYFNDQWYLCTHKKLNAFRSRWSCKQTFGELFVESLEEIYDRKLVLEWLQEQLPKDKVYFFLVRANTQNRIVCHAHHLKRSENIVFLGHYGLGHHEEGSFQFYQKGECPDSLAVLRIMESPPLVPTLISNVEDMCKVVQGLDPFLYQGVIGFHKGGFDTFKFLNTDYVRYFNVRGNNPNLRFRYLEVRNQPEQLKLLYVLYPKYTILFNEYESTLFEIAKVIYQFYVNRYIKNQYITLPREEYLLLKKCHQWYLQDRKNNRIFTQKVLEILGNEPPLHLYKMIRRFHLESNGDTRHQQTMPYARTDMKIEVPVYNQKRNKEFMASLPPLSPTHIPSAAHATNQEV